MNAARRKLYRSLAARALFRVRPAAAWNYVKYRRSIERVRREGPDRLRFAPVSVVVWVTARCNRNCAFCHYSGELNPADGGGLELDCAGFERILRHPLVSKAVRVCLYGGEPLLNRDLCGMIELAKRLGHLVTVNTNGLLLDERREELLASRPDLLSVSYYPEDRAALAGSVPRIAPRVATKFILLLCEDHLGAVPEALRLAEEAGVRAVSFEHPCPNRAGDNRALADGDPRLAGLKAEMNARYGSRLWMTWPSPSPGEPTCRFFWNSLFVNARGQVSPCCVWPVSTYEGDLFADEDVWNSERMMRLRADMRKGGLGERCRACPYLHDDPLEI